MDKVERNTDAGEVRLRRPDRAQAVMTVQCPDDLIGPDHPVRVVERVVRTLDLSKFREPIKARAGVCGRDATDPALLVGLWLYAATDGVGSARELARRCDPKADGCRPYLWLCGGVSVNHHTLADFRVDHAQALDQLLTQVIATLVAQKLVKVYRISQDGEGRSPIPGTRVRACAGASSYRRSERLGKLLEAAKAHVAELKALLEDPEKSAGLSARKKAAQARAAREREERIARAIKALPALKARQEKLAERMSQKQKQKVKEPRASTTDDQARVMKMPNGGFNPALNVQLAVDTDSRAIVGVEVVGAGTDTGQAEPMRKQVEQRTGQKVSEHLMDGGYLVNEEVERAAAEGVSLLVPPKPPRNKDKRGSEYQPRPTDSPVIRDWRTRMGSPQGKQVYKLRAASSETVNADLKTHRGMGRLLVRGVKKAKCVALWCALAYNLMHFAPALLVG